MSGLQEIAAIIGVAEVSIRGISRLHKLLKDLKNAPKEIETLREETSGLYQTLSALQGLIEKSNVDDIGPLAQELRLISSLNRCGQACTKLQSSLPPINATEARTLLGRVKSFRRKKSIENVVDEIQRTQKIVLLTISVTNLAVQWQSASSEVETRAALQALRAQIAEVSAKLPAMPTYNEIHTLNGTYPKGTQALPAQAKKSEMDGNQQSGHTRSYEPSRTDTRDSGFSEPSSLAGSVRAASKIVEEADVKFEDMSNKGARNVFGVKTNQDPGKPKIDFKKVNNEGDDNVFGISRSG